MHKLSKDSEKDGNTPLSSTVWNIRPPVTWIWANWEKVKDREAWCATVYRVAKSWTWLSNWTSIASDINGNPGQPGILLHATKIKLVPTQNQFIHRILDIFSPPCFQELLPEALGNSKRECKSSSLTLISSVSFQKRFELAHILYWVNCLQIIKRKAEHLTARSDACELSGVSWQQFLWYHFFLETRREACKTTNTDALRVTFMYRRQSTV